MVVTPGGPQGEGNKVTGLSAALLHTKAHNRYCNPPPREALGLSEGAGITIAETVRRALGATGQERPTVACVGVASAIGLGVFSLVSEHEVL